MAAVLIRSTVTAEGVSVVPTVIGMIDLVLRTQIYIYIVSRLIQQCILNKMY